MKKLYISAFLVMAATGCAKEAAVTTDDTAVKAAKIADAIAANPAGADSILKSGGYTRKSFDEQLLDIAADSAMSARYAAAKSK